MKKIIFLIIMTLITIIGYSQVDTPFDKNHITDKTQLKEANKKIKEGDKLFAMGKGRYIDALTYYLEANKINPTNADLNYKIGICYLFTTDKQLGLEHLEKAKQLNPQVNYELSYYLGRAYHLNHQFDKAIEYYNEFKNRLYPQKFTVRRSKEVDKLIEECENGKEFIENPLNVKIANIGSTINTLYPDYAPVISADEKILFFTSRRPSTTGGKRDPIDNKYYEDIFMTTKKDTTWQLPTILDINDKKHNGAIGIYNWEGKTYLYTYKSKHNGDIYESIINDNNITIPEPLPNPINTRFHESSASLSPDGNYLYFISDRPGGMGGKDIWMSQKEHNDTWTNPINLSAINTPYDEEGVFIHPDGKTLYFSSEGHNTMGGYDIFRTEYDGKTWSKPINLGYPINTADDDLCIVFASSGQRAYFSSSRQGTIGDQDIYIINFLKEKPLLISEENEYVSRQNQPIKSLDTINQSIIKESENLKNGIVLNNIFFNYNKATLRPESKTELENLIKLMNDNPNIKIEISGHTDNIGSAAYNQKLSESRAKAVVDYLIEHGIERSRLSYRGYGFDKPIAPNDTEEGRQLNRRVEFKIIKVN